MNFTISGRSTMKSEGRIAQLLYIDQRAIDVIITGKKCSLIKYVRCLTQNNELLP